VTLPLKHVRRFAAVAAVLLVGTTLVAIAGPVLHWVIDYGVQREVLHTHPVGPDGGGAPGPAVASVAAPKVAEGIPASDPAAAPLAAVATAPGRVETNQVPTQHFTTLGVKLAHATSSPILVRWQGTAGWSDWHQMDVEADAGPDHGSAEGTHAAAVDPGVETEPLWVGDGSAYQVNLSGSSGKAGSQVLLVRADGRHLEAESAPPVAGASLLNQPAIHPRSDWGAAAPTGTISAAPDLKMAVVHHSDTGNNYTPAQVPSMIRAVQAFHIEGRDWSDIGYNFIVDRFGGIWEGRAGSIDQLSIGAHAQGFNTSTIGVMVLGNYSAVGPSAAALDSVAKVIAWEFANHGVNPDTPVAYTSGGSLSIPAGETRSFPRIVGHRDVGATSCPGTFLYPHLGDVRALVDAKYPGASSPAGVVDVASGGPTSIFVAGWAIDPNTTDPIEVHVYIDGVGTNLGLASDSRPDLAEAFPGSSGDHGYSHVFDGLSPGVHEVCVFGINSGPGNNTLIRCQAVTVPTGSPIGVVDEAVMGPDGVLAVSGWSLDPDTTVPIQDRVYVDGQYNPLVPTGVTRPDVAAFFPLYGAQHGFTGSTTVTPAPHEVCVFAINSAGPGDNTLLSCRAVAPPSGSPIGVVDVATGGPDGTAFVTGWTFDPDTAAPIETHIYIDGVGTNLGSSTGSRPDIAAAFPGYGPSHGFTDNVTGLTPGKHQVCVFGINVGPGTNTLIKCTTITVPSGSPVGVVDTAAPAGGGRVTVAGWTIDPDTAAPTQVHVYVDGVGTNTGLTSVSRPDVAAAFPGYGALHGYSWTSTALTAGVHQVCVFGINAAGAGTNTLLACRAITV